jgi:Ca-activated chloride channel family protein
MRNPIPIVSCFLAWLLLAATPGTVRAEPTDPYRSLSPYFVVEGADSAVDGMPLEASRAEINIAGVMADVVVTQVYRNQGTTPIHARYVFPASTRAAVYGMKMTIGNRVILAKIKEREEARKEYEAAKAEGKSASLLEQDRPNVFSMNVSNILPGDRIEVELRYTELLVPDAGEYELVYPAVVGPRYAAEGVDKSDPSNRFVAAPFLKKGVASSTEFGVKVKLAAGMPIESMVSPSHGLQASFGSERKSASLELAPGISGNRDFVLRYRLRGKELTSGLLLYEGQDENFFLMMVQPPERPALEAIPTREYVFILDVSGSMRGFPLDVSKQLMRDLLGRMRPTDRFNVVLFSGGSSVWAERSMPASARAIDEALAFVDKEDGSGGTELLEAMKTSMSLPREESNVARSFVVVTDGFIAEEPEAFEYIRNNLNRANVFSFGIGSGVNRFLVDGVARAGQGDSFVILDAKEAGPAAARFREYVETPVLTGVNVAFNGFQAYEVSPSVVADVFAQRPVIVFGKWKGPAKGTITVTGATGRGRFEHVVDVAASKPDPGSVALRYLWARDRISALSDFAQRDANRDQVLALGLKYNLLTRFTSFIAVHQVVRATGQAVEVDQPSPLPEGVEESAVGMESGPEPALWLLLGMLAAAAIWQQRRTVRHGSSTGRAL